MQQFLGLLPACPLLARKRRTVTAAVGSAVIRTVRHNFFTHGSQRRFAPNLDLWDRAAAGGLVTHIAADGPIQYGYAPHSCYIFGGG
jgi:hypothetical protein